MYFKLLKESWTFPCLYVSSLTFSDLVHTTESLRQCRLSSVKAEKDSANFDFVLEPYKLENTRLNKENNELYLELMKLREYSDKHIKGTYNFDDDVFKMKASCPLCFISGKGEHPFEILDMKKASPTNGSLNTVSCNK